MLRPSRMYVAQHSAAARIAISPITESRVQPPRASAPASSTMPTVASTTPTRIRQPRPVIAAIEIGPMNSMATAGPIGRWSAAV